MDYLLTYKSRFLSAPPFYPKVLAAYTPHMAPIWRRVETSYHLVGMSLEETKNYINHQTKAAGCEHPLFPDDVTSKIHERAKGIPALVNILCKGCLQDAAGRDQTLIDGENVNRVLQEWQ